MALVEAARLEKTAGAGEIRCTDVLRLLATEEDPALFVDPEDVPFKGFGETRRVWRIDWETGPAGTGRAAAARAPASAAPRDVFVGRAVERARVVRNWEQAQRSGNRLVVRVGRGRDRQVGAGPRRGPGSPSATGVGALRPLRPRSGHALPTVRRGAGDVHPGLRRLAPAPRARPRPPAGARGRPRTAVSVGSSGLAPIRRPTRYELFAAVADWLATISRDNGVLFVIDDLDLADDPTLELVRHVLRAASTGNVCLLATCRWSEHPLERRGWECLHDLLRLDDRWRTFRYAGSVAARCRRCWRQPRRPGTARRPATAAFVHELCTFTGGNPLFVHAVLSDVPDDVVARLRGGGRDPIPLGVPERRPGAVPQAPAPPVRARPGAARRRPASSGRRSRTSSSRPPPACRRRRQPRAFAGCADRDSCAAGRAGGHQFTHALIHEAARRNLGDDERVELHLRIAHALERRRGSARRRRPS